MDTLGQGVKFSVPVNLQEGSDRRKLLVKQLQTINQKLTEIKIQRKARTLQPTEIESLRTPLVQQITNVTAELMFINGWIKEAEVSKPGTKLKVLGHFRKKQQRIIGQKIFDEPVSMADADARKASLAAEVKKIEGQLTSLKSRYSNLKDMTPAEAHWRSRAIMAKNIMEAEMVSLREWIRARRKELDEVEVIAQNLMNPKVLLSEARIIIKRYLPWRELDNEVRKKADLVCSAIEKYILEN